VPSGAPAPAGSRRRVAGCAEPRAGDTPRSGRSRHRRPGSDRLPDDFAQRRTHAGPMETLIKTAAARAVALTKIYGAGEAAVRALDRVTAEFPRERFTAIMGPSGSGKSTLMHCLAGLDQP